MSRVAFITSGDYPELDGEAHLVDAFREAGHEPSIAVWDDASIDWSRYDYAIIRSCYDIVDKPGEFKVWLKNVANQVIVLNSPEILQWNSHKSYLEWLKDKGISIPKSSIYKSDCPDKTLRNEHAGAVVIKPCVGCSGSGVELFPSFNKQAYQYLEKLLLEGDALVQDYMPSIQNGEISAVFFNNAFSHAVRKIPAKGEFRINWKFGGRPVTEELSVAQIKDINAIYAKASIDTLYARVDLIEYDDSLILMELEVLDPYLYIEGNNDLAKRLAEAFNDYLGRASPSMAEEL